MRTTKTLSLLGAVALAMLLAAPAWAHGFGARGFGRGGFRGGYYRGGGYSYGGHFTRHYGYSYSRPFYRHYSYGYSYPRYSYGYSYPGYGFYGYGGGFGLGFSYGPSYYDYGPSPYVYYAPSYPIVIQRDVVRYRERDREEDREPARSASVERYWLVASRDHSIRAVSDYWLEGSTLHYVTREGTRSSVELSEVDIAFTKELNRERGLEFRLPRSSDDYQPRRRDSFGRSY